MCGEEEPSAVVVVVVVAVVPIAYCWRYVDIPSDLFGPLHKLEGSNESRWRVAKRIQLCGRDSSTSSIATVQRASERERERERERE